MNASQTFGKFFQQKRIEMGVTLREFCRRNDLDPGHTSKIERDLVTPPQSKDLLERRASALGIQKATEDWFTFFDLASTGAGKIPPEMLSNDEVMNALPILFRTVRNEKPTEADIEKLINAIKKDLR